VKLGGPEKGFKENDFLRGVEGESLLWARDGRKGLERNLHGQKQNTSFKQLRQLSPKTQVSRNVVAQKGQFYAVPPKKLPKKKEPLPRKRRKEPPLRQSYRIGGSAP